MNSRRIDLLDSFRFLAILPVLLYHFTIEWKDQTPYGNYFGGLFKYGYLGVEFFFVISGFVISYTLEGTDSFFSFWKNRFIRLFPPLLACTMITYGVAGVLDSNQLFPNAHKIRNFLPTFTLTNPSIWTSLTHTHFAWINGSYWSLWVEIQFYILSSILYFWNKGQFLRNILLAAMTLSVVKYIPPYFLHSGSWGVLSGRMTGFLSGWVYMNAVFNIDYYILWFTLGVIFHHLYKGFPIRSRPLTAICMVIVLYQLYMDRLYAERIYAIRVFQLIIITLFLLLIYKKEYLSFMNKALFKRIGIISYSMYLIHEVTGTLLINKYGAYLGRYSPLSLVIMVILIIVFAELSYRFYETKAGSFLKKILHKPTSISAVP
ncbi:MAG TPA: acyltransferase [Puia sp.]|nr:acyltransferase [Puia sp.]